MTLFKVALQWSYIDKKVNVVTDKWRGYLPIAKEYDITQIESNNGATFKALHTMIHIVKL